MQKIEFKTLHIHDQSLIQQIAIWYHTMWNIPIKNTEAKLMSVCADTDQWHCVAFENDVPIATGGVHHGVSLSAANSRYEHIAYWLALVYTAPAARNKGIGSQLCEYLVKQAIEKKIQTLYLFTDTAENMYTRLGWECVEHVKWQNRNISVMKKRCY